MLVVRCHVERSPSTLIMRSRLQRRSRCDHDRMRNAGAYNYLCSTGGQISAESSQLDDDGLMAVSCCKMQSSGSPLNIFWQMTMIMRTA